jgi:hypothetical protein
VQLRIEFTKRCPVVCVGADFLIPQWQRVLSQITGPTAVIANRFDLRLQKATYFSALRIFTMTTHYDGYVHTDISALGES